MKTNKLTPRFALLCTAALLLGILPVRAVTSKSHTSVFSSLFLNSSDEDDDGNGGNNGGNENGNNQGNGNNEGNGNNNGNDDDDDDGCNTAPTAICKSISINLNSSGSATIVPENINNGSHSNCNKSTITIEASKTTFDCSNLGANAVTLTVKDSKNNKTASCTATVTVLDPLAPTAIAKNVTVSLNSSGGGSISANDVDNGSSDNCSIVSKTVTPSSFTCNDLNSGPLTTTLTTSKSWSLSTSTETSGMTQYGAHNWYGVSGGLPSAGTYTLTPTENPYATVLVPGTYGLDAADGVRFYKQSFTLTSIANIKATILVSVDNALQIYINGTAVALENSDNQSNFNDAVYSKLVLNSSGSNSTGGSGFQDFDSYTSTNASSLFVVGNNEIVLAVANWDNQNQTYQDHGTISLKATIETAGGNVIPVALTVTDASGNSSTAYANVTVLDEAKPTALCKNKNLTLSNGAGSITANDIDNSSYDNCSITTKTLSKYNFTCEDNGSSTVTLTVTDASGNTATCDATVTIDAIYSADAGSNAVVYYGAPAPWSCAQLTATGAGGSGYTYSWSNGTTTKNNKVCPSTSTTYTVNITDNQGCSESNKVDVCAFDIRCSDKKEGKGEKHDGKDDDDDDDDGHGHKCGKVQMCHHTSCKKSEHDKCNHSKTKSGKYETVCVKADSATIASHLKHGDMLGTCGVTYSCNSNSSFAEEDDLVWDLVDNGTTSIQAYPNPFSSGTKLLFSVPSDQAVTIKAYTTTGQEVAVLFNGTASADMPIEIDFKPADYASGTFIIKMTTDAGISKQLIVVKSY